MKVNSLDSALISQVPSRYLPRYVQCQYRNHWYLKSIKLKGINQVHQTFKYLHSTSAALCARHLPGTAESTRLILLK